MYCKKAVETMKAEKPARSFCEDKELLNIFDNKLVDILAINAAYHIDFPSNSSINYLCYNLRLAKT